MRIKPSPPVRLLHELLHYDHFTGVFTWKVNPRLGRTRKGAVAGSVTKLGYVRIGISGWGQHAAHRLAWAYVHGAISEEIEIDHIDGNPSNNSINNLRLATSSEQKRNKRVQSNNRCGLKGAYYHACRKGKMWRSQIRVDGRFIFLGYFRTPEEAHAAYGRAASFYYGEFARAA